MPAPQDSDTLKNVEARVEQVLCFQKLLEQNVADLSIGQSATQRAIEASQAATQRAIAALGQSLGRRPPGRLSSDLEGAAAATSQVQATATQRNARGSSAELRLSFDRGLDRRSVPLRSSSGFEADGTGTRSGWESSGVKSEGLSLFKPGRLTMVEPTGTSTKQHMEAIALQDSLVMGSEEPSVLHEDEVDQKLIALLFEKLPNSSRVDHEQYGRQQDSRWRRAMDPHCRFRALHDLLSIVVLFADVITAPVMLAWDLTVEGFLRVLNITSLIFWSIDIAMSFGTGFYIQGELESRLWPVAKRYLKSWFLPDVVIVVVDLFTLTIGGGSSDSSMQNGSRALRLSKASRFLRLARLCRLARVAEVFARLTETNIYLDVFIETMKPLLALSIVNHMLACTWWSISTFLPTDTGFRWVDEPVSPGSEVTYLQTGWMYQYLTCAHWALLQLAFGSMEVSPRNSIERAFSCMGLLMGMFLFSALVSSISAKMMNHYMQQKDKLQKLASLRKFLVNKVHPGITIAAQFQATKAMWSNSGKPLTIKEVTAIGLLPQALQRKIHFELCSKHLRHPLLRFWFLLDPQGQHVFCHSAVDFIGLAEEDTLFLPRTAAIGAYIMISGTATYNLKDEFMEVNVDKKVYQGKFFCEVALWCKWKHLGELTATTASEVLLISTTGLIKCLEQDRFVKHVVMEYGRSFHARLTAALLEEEPPDDLGVSLTEFDRIVPLLAPDCRQLISAVALNKANKTRWPSKDWSKEVREEKSCLMLNWDGEVERIVSVILLRLMRQDGRILVQLGTWSGDSAQASCKLPGAKQMFYETPNQTISRVLLGPMAPFANTISCTCSETEVTWEVSKRMQMTTKYLRTIRNAELTSPAESLGLEQTQLHIHTQLRGRRQSRRQSLTNVLVPMHLQSMQEVAEEVSRADTEPVPDLCIYALASEDKEIVLVGWLTAEEMSTFTSPKGAAHLQRVVDQLALEPSVLEAARARFAASQAAVSSL